MWELDYKESRAPKIWCFWIIVLEKTLESPLNCKEIQPVHPKGISPEYSLEGLMLKRNSNILVTWWKELIHSKRPWCWEKLKVGEGDDRGWDCWMVSPIKWTWIWEGSESRWWTGRPCVQHAVQGSQKLGTTELLNWTAEKYEFPFVLWNSSSEFFFFSSHKWEHF